MFHNLTFIYLYDKIFQCPTFHLSMVRVSMTLNTLIRPTLHIQLIKKRCWTIQNIFQGANNNRPNVNLNTSDPIFKTLNILKFNHLFELNCKLFMHSFYNNKLPSCFSEMIKKSVSTRTNNIVANICKKSNLRHLPKYILPKLWNSIKIS